MLAREFQPYNMLRSHFNENIRPQLTKIEQLPPDDDFSGVWYNTPLLINKMILKKCDVASKLKIATLSAIDRDLVHSVAPLCPHGAAYVDEPDVFYTCIRLFIERITFRIRWSESRQRFILFSPRTSRVQPKEPDALEIGLKAIPPKALRYLIKKTAFEALYDSTTDDYNIYGMDNSCDFRFPRR